MSKTLRSVQTRNPGITVFNAVTLTSAFSGNRKVIPIGGADEVVLYTSWTPDTNGDDVDIQIEFSPDNSNWYIDSSLSASSGTITVYDSFYRYDGAVAATVYKSRLAIPVADLYMRISVRYNGTGNGTVSMKMIKSGN